MAVAVEGDLDRRVAHVGRDCLGVRASNDKQGGEGVTSLVQFEGFDLGGLPALRKPLNKRRVPHRLRLCAAKRRQQKSLAADQVLVLDKDGVQSLGDRDDPVGGPRLRRDVALLP